MAEVYQVRSRTNFAGGLNASSSIYEVAENQLLRVENLLLDQTGALSSRDGALTIDTAQTGTSAVLTLYDLVKASGTLYKLAVRRSPSGQFLNQRGAGDPWPQLGTFTTQYDLPYMVTFADRAIIASGYEPIKYWDGTTFGSLTAAAPPAEVVPPGAKHLAVHYGRLWIWNTAATTNATDGPSSLRHSGQDNPNSWPVANQTFINVDDGQTGTGLATFTIADTGINPQGILVAFKEFSTYNITGVFGSSNFNVDKAKTDLGCIAPRSIQFVASAGIMRLTHRGFAIFNGQQDTLVSEPIRPYLFAQRSTADIAPVTWAQLGRSTATLVQNPPLYLCACPFGSGPELTRVFVYDLLRQAWSILRFPVPFATVDAQYDPGVQPYVLAGEQGGGRVQRLFGGDALDDGVAVAWKVRLPPLRGRSPAQRLYVRRCLVKATNMKAGQAVTGRAVMGPAQQQRGPRTRISVTSVATPLLSTSGIEGEVEATLNYDIHRTGEVLHYELEGSDHIVIREIVQHAIQKPVSRPMRL